MDVKRLVKSVTERAARAREFEHTVKGVRNPRDPAAAPADWTFKLRRPSDLQLEESIAINQRFGSNVGFKRDQVAEAVFGWEGPTVGDVDPEADGVAAREPLPFAQSLTVLLFEDRTEVLNELADKLVEQYQARLAEREAAAKN